MEKRKNSIENISAEPTNGIRTGVRPADLGTCPGQAQVGYLFNHMSWISDSSQSDELTGRQDRHRNRGKSFSEFPDCLGVLGGPVAIINAYGAGWGGDEGIGDTQKPLVR